MSKKSRTTTFLLAFFLGTFGAHRFYVGKNGSAVAMIVLTCSIIGLPVSSIWTIVDWVKILVGTFKDKEGKQVQNWQ